MDVTYYPGCSLESSARDYDESIKAVCKALDIHLHEPEDWTCCGATSAHSLDESLAVMLPARNLSEKMQVNQNMLVPCPLCFNRLIRAQESVTSSVDIYDLASFLGQAEWLEKIKSRMVFSLNDIKAVCYYGCMANRPPGITGSADYENPRNMDRIAKTLEVNVKPWSYKTDCCGAGFSVSRPDIVYTLVKGLYDKALEAGAECIIVSCQMCHANLDLYQEDISKHFATKYNIPIFYFTELIGLSLGLKDTAVWLKRHMVDPTPLLEKNKA